MQAFLRVSVPIYVSSSCAVFSGLYFSISLFNLISVYSDGRVLHSVGNTRPSFSQLLVHVFKAR